MYAQLSARIKSLANALAQRQSELDQLASERDVLSNRLNAERQRRRAAEAREQRLLQGDVGGEDDGEGDGGEVENFAVDVGGSVHDTVLGGGGGGGGGGALAPRLDGDRHRTFDRANDKAPRRYVIMLNGHNTASSCLLKVQPQAALQHCCMLSNSSHRHWVIVVTCQLT